MESKTEWLEREYNDLVNAAQSVPEAAFELSSFKEFVSKGKRPIVERRIVGRHSFEYRVRDIDAYTKEQ